MTKELYFLINYPRDKEENPKEIYFEKKSIKPKCIFMKCDYENKKYNYKKIFKFESSAAEKYRLEFVNGEDRYVISFPCQKNTFIYDVTLEKGLNIIPVKRKIGQNPLDYKEKMNLFIMHWKIIKKKIKLKFYWKTQSISILRKKDLIF